MKTGFLLFEQYHQRKNIGSSRIRGDWVLKYMKNAERFVQGENYDAIVFQKVYWKEMAREFKGVKILDICDPDWMEGADVVQFANEMDYIVTSTDKLKEVMEKFTDVPIECIPDRIDFETLPKTVKQHKGRAKKVCWFGYSHNAEVLDVAYYKIKKLGLELVVISDGNIRTSQCNVKNVKWNADTYNEEIINCDFVIIPETAQGRHAFKSNNKIVHSWALGMPVARTATELDLFMDGYERAKEAEIRRKEVLENYDVKLSAKRYEEIIKKIHESK